MIIMRFDEDNLNDAGVLQAISSFLLHLGVHATTTVGVVDYIKFIRCCRIDSVESFGRGLVAHYPVSAEMRESSLEVEAG